MELARAAREVLNGNWLGTATRPGPRLYPHQWSWDSAFTAIGWSHVQWERAATELRTLFAAQWPNGMLPHIVFHDGAADYFPGPDVWDTPRAFGRPSTSGIVQSCWGLTGRARLPEPSTLVIPIPYLAAVGSPGAGFDVVPTDCVAAMLARLRHGSVGS